MDIVFHEFRDGFLSFLGILGSSFPDLVILENRSANRRNFVTKTDPTDREQLSPEFERGYKSIAFKED